MSNHVPLAERIATDIKRQIALGQLSPGSGLASLRDQAQACGAAKNTVVKAYEMLVAEGFIEPRRGSGFYVAGRNPHLRVMDGWAPALDLALSAVGIGRHETNAVQGAPSLGEGLPPSAWLEGCRLDRYMQKIGRSGLGTVFRYGDPAGYLPLRKNIAARLQGFGMAVDTAQIVLTQGAYQAVDLVIRHLVRPGDHVLVDDPGFYPTFNKLRLQGAQIHGVPRTPAGPDIGVLSQLLQRHKPHLFFTQSCGHNPTGSDMTGSMVQELTELAQRYSLVMVDDDALGDFAPLRAPRIGGGDQLAQSIYVGSFSKSLSSVVRVGFLACRADLARELTQVKTIVSLNSSLYAERTVDAVITEGRFRKHALALRAKTRNATRAALSLFDEHGVEVFARPEQSLYLWARLPGVEDSLSFARQMFTRGIAMAPGAIFSPDATSRSSWFRFNVGFLGPESAISEVLALTRPRCLDALRPRP
ncbi:PLP-dependent aminotransferase family protein [Stenotrophomonas sp. YIM B06876]|uniref:aminotransferase-like domain-containing protein n=1 Tax=Stenotrophomonas sp. YIM B06876 TaxID=3060211 RepID=UPI00273972A2|nr:PLP-dependent aminotransferase family protein [Stenotrophomonas sp. YIM B06876]